MMENPAFNEAQLLPKTPLKKERMSIDRSKVADIEGMQELWDTIDSKQRLLDFNLGKDVSDDSKYGGKTMGEMRKLDDAQIYRLRHYIIELRKQQYYLMDVKYPTFTKKMADTPVWRAPSDLQLNFNFLPNGLMSTQNDDHFLNPSLCKKQRTLYLDRNFATIDFRKREHMEKILLLSADLTASAIDIGDSPVENLNWTLEFYISKANLSEVQKILVRERMKNTPVKDIAAVMKKETGKARNVSYLSTMWKNTLNKICEAVEMNEREQSAIHNYTKWKCCSCCEEVLLIDSKNFVKKRNSRDGFTSVCKSCEKKRRNGEKI